MLSYWFEKNRIKKLKGIDRELDKELENLEIIYSDHHILLKLLKDFIKDYDKGKFKKLEAEVKKIENLVHRDVSYGKKEEKITIKAIKVIDKLLKKDSIKEKKIDHKLEMKLDLLREHFKTLGLAIKNLLEFFEENKEDLVKIRQNIHKLIESVDEIGNNLHWKKEEVASIKKEIGDNLKSSFKPSEADKRDEKNFFMYTYPFLKQMEKAAKKIVARIDAELKEGTLTLERLEVYKNYINRILESFDKRLSQYERREKISYSDLIAFKTNLTGHRLRNVIADDFIAYIKRIKEYLKTKKDKPKFKREYFIGKKYFLDTFKGREYAVVDDMDEFIDDLMWYFRDTPRNFVHATKGEELILFFNRRLLKEVLYEFVNNAIYWTSENGIIEIGAKKEGENIEIWIKDNGKGISKEDIPHIFDLYFTKREGGTGRGLAYNRYIIRKYFGGDVKVESKVGKGTTFTVVIPYDKVKPPESK